MEDSVILAGIDEAGYGPILGPLVVSASAFVVPSTLADTPLWDVLRMSVSRTASSRGTGIPILDSKKLYHRKAGLAKLERSVLSAIKAWRGLPDSLERLLGLLCREVIPLLKEYAWYRDANPTLPMAADSGGIRIAGKLLSRDLDEQSCQLAGCWSEVLPEGHYNQLIDSTNNKAVVLSGLTLRLIQRIADAFPDRELRITIDKQGGRDHYAPMLLQAFEDRRLKIIEESSLSSAYILSGRTANWRISYHQGGESLHMPVALASLVSKYLRELLMACFNDYWARNVPDLKPTAGYYQDGKRFLRDIDPHLQRLGIQKDRLIRQR